MYVWSGLFWSGLVSGLVLVRGGWRAFWGDEMDGEELHHNTKPPRDWGLEGGGVEGGEGKEDVR